MLSRILLSIVITLLKVVPVHAACDYGTFQFPREAQAPVSKFSYDGQSGPLNWFALNMTANALCGNGTDQSPITLSADNTTDTNGSLSLKIPDYPNGAQLENIGTNIQVVANGTLVDAGKIYTMAQFHFHSPSEHRIDDQYFPMEAHFVFQANDSSLAVVGFFIELGEGDPMLTSVFAPVTNISSPGNTTMTLPLQFSTLQTHLTNNSVYRYTGSLTTPPCSENVKWIISNSPLQIDADRYQDVKKVIRFNARYTQNGIGQLNLLANAADEFTRARQIVLEVQQYKDYLRLGDDFHRM